MVKPVQIVGVDSSIIQNPKAWVASGHVGGFSDPMVDCKESKKRYRQDHFNRADATLRIAGLLFTKKPKMMKSSLSLKRSTSNKISPFTSASTSQNSAPMTTPKSSHRMSKNPELTEPKDANVPHLCRCDGR